MKNVFCIKWLDSYGAQSGWQKIDDYSANKLVITSIGKIVYESDDVISIAGNFSEETEYTPNQANGIMTIPKVSIISISSVSCGPELELKQKQQLVSL